MTKIALLLSLTGILILTNSTFSQSRFLKPGISGFGIGGEYLTNSDADGFGGALGYSVNGFFDIGVAIGRISTKNALFSDELKATTIAPGLNFIFLKQGQNNVPLSVSFSGSYARGLFDSGDLDLLGVDLSSNTFSFGLSVFGNVETSPSVHVQPIVGAAYNINSFTVTDQATGESITEENNNFSFDFGISFVLGASSNPIFYLSPAVDIAEDVTTFNINAGFVFPSGSKQQKPTPSRSDDELDALIFGQPGTQQLEIRSVSNNYLLVYSTPQTPMLTGKSYNVMRYDNFKWVKIGTAKVIRIKDNKVALEASLYDRDDRITKNDRIEYK